MTLKDFLKSNFKNGVFIFWVLMVIVAILPLYYWYLPPFIILLAILWILENISRFRTYFSERSSHRVLMALFIALFLWQTAGLIYSQDIKLGVSNIFGRLSFVAFPLILFNPSRKIKENNHFLLKVFVLSTLLYVLICFGYALIRSLSVVDGSIVFNPHPSEYEWNSYFSGSDFTFSIHPSYLAMFVVLAAFISFEAGKKSTSVLAGQIGWYFLGFFLIISLFFIASRAGILAGILLMLLYATVNIFRTGKSKILWIGIIIIMISLLPLFRNNDRVEYVLKNITYYFSGSSEDGQTDDRIIAWQSSVKLIKQNPVFGVGIGDVRAELVKEYERVNAKTLSSQRLNVHNQFLEIFLENGIIGFVIFLWIFGLMILLAFREKNLLYGIFIVMMVIFFMFETVLYRLAGVAFFSLFSFLLLHAKSWKSLC
jgi:hypothetical protein